VNPFLAERIDAELRKLLPDLPEDPEAAARALLVLQQAGAFNEGGRYAGELRRAFVSAILSLPAFQEEEP